MIIKTPFLNAITRLKDQRYRTEMDMEDSSSAWSHMPIILGFGSVRQENETEACLDYTMRPCVMRRWLSS